MIEQESIQEKQEEVIVINEFEEPKPEPKKKRGGKCKKGAKKSEKAEHDLSELTGYEHLTTPELIKLTVELDEKEKGIIHEEDGDEVLQLDSEAYNEALKNVKATPVARRTRGKRTKN